MENKIDSIFLINKNATQKMVKCFYDIEEKYQHLILNQVKTTFKHEGKIDICSKFKIGKNLSLANLQYKK
jgi:hypothetical protein